MAYIPACNKCLRRMKHGVDHRHIRVATQSIGLHNASRCMARCGRCNMLCPWI